MADAKDAEEGELNTTYGNYEEACSDCLGERGDAAFKHWGHLVPPGTTGYFCEPCMQDRNADSKAGLPPRPLGSRAIASAA